MRGKALTTRVLLLIVCAVLTFGGTFTCTTSTDGNHPPPPAPTPH